MIVKNRWILTHHFESQKWVREGWYLFGIIPLYLRDVTPRPI